jgi:hypothetical protein
MIAANHHIVAARRFGFSAGERKHNDACQGKPDASDRKPKA